MKKPIMNIRKIIGMSLNSAMNNLIATSEHIVQELEKAPIHWNTTYEPTVTATFSKKKPAYEKRLIIRKYNYDVDATIYFTKKTKIARVVWNRLVPQGRGYHDTDLPSINTALKAKDILSTNAIMDVLFSYIMGITQPESEVSMNALHFNISDKKNKIISHMFGQNLEYNHHEMSWDEAEKARQLIYYLKSLVNEKIMQANPMTIRKSDMLKKHGDIKAITEMPDEVRIRVMVNRQSEVKYIVSDGACFNREGDQNVNTMFLLNENMKVVAIVYAASVDGLACGRHEHMAIYVMKYLLAHGMKRVKEMFWMTDIKFENANAYAIQMIENVSCMSFTKTDPQTRECFISKMIKNLCDPICSMAIGNNLLRKMAIA